MSRPSVPPIPHRDLRDHADQARIHRIWERLEGDLVAGAPEARPRRTTVLVLALVATFAAFGGGLLVGKRIWSAPPGPTTIESTLEHVDIDIFAAGEHDRSFDLAGVGQLRLKPGATVEMDKTGGAVTLRLVRGEASVDKIVGNRVALVAGEARLSTRSGSSVTMHKNDDGVDVRVDDGSAELASPAGTQHMKPGEEVRHVPIHSAVAGSPRDSSTKRRQLSLPVPGDPAPEAVHPAVAAPPWLVAHDAEHDAEAYEALKQQPGGLEEAIAGAQSASELISISDVASRAGDSAAAIRALKRVVEGFPNSDYVQVAAHKLERHYEGTDPGKAKQYAALYRSLSPNGAFAEDALCNEIRAEKHKAEAMRKAEEYVKKYPDGNRCKDEALAIGRGEGSFADDSAGSVERGPSAVAPSAPVAPKLAPRP
jgi:hypothetical protein